MLDIHAHILPETDDGATDLAMTQAMLAAASAAGIDRIIAAPRLGHGQSVRQQQRHLDAVREAAQAQGITVFPGCEVPIDALPALLDGPLDDYRLGAEGFLLLAFHTEAAPFDWAFAVSDLVRRGWRPVIAHPEQYAYVQKDLRVAEEMIAYGCELQLGAAGLLASRLTAQGRTARALLAAGMVAYVASDAHRPSDYAGLRRVMRRYAERWPKDGRLEAALLG